MKHSSMKLKMACVDSDKFSASDLCLFIESIEKINQIERLRRERQLQYRAQYLAETLRYLDQQYPASSSSTLSSTDDPEDESILENIEEKEILYNGPHYAVKDLIYDETYRDVKNSTNSTGLMQNVYCHIDRADVENSYEDHYRSWQTRIYDKHCLASTKISQSRSSCISSIGIYEQIPVADSSSTCYEEPLECMRSTKIARPPIDSSDLYERVSFEISKSNGSNSSSSSSDETDDVLLKKPSLKRCLMGLVCKKYRKPIPSNTRNWCKSKSWMKLAVV